MKRTKTPREIFAQVDRIFALSDRSCIGKKRVSDTAKIALRYVNNIYTAAGIPDHNKSNDTKACNRVFHHGAYPREIYAAE